MTRHTTRTHARLAALCTALLCLPLPLAFAAKTGAASAPAARPATHAHAGFAAGQAEALVQWTRESFTLSPQLAVDADARHRTEALAAGFAERQRPLYERWIRELLEHPTGNEDAMESIPRVKAPRFVATLADWRLRSAGPAHEALLRQAAMASADCRIADDAATALDELAILVQATPPAQRDIFMEGERRLLAQWGGKPPVLANNMEEPGRDVGRWALALRRGEPHDTLPMAPRLAGLIIPEPPQEVWHAGRCAIRQWWLANRLRQTPAASEAIWQAWHLAFARDLTAMNNTAPPYPAATGPIDYPKGALNLGLEGTVSVRVERDARGHFKSGVVTARRLSAQTLPGRPVPMFEQLLDAASLSRARKLTNEQAEAAAPGASAATAGSGAFDFKWRMQ